MKKFLHFILTFCLIGGCIKFSTIISAQEIGLILSPPITVIDAKPGQQFAVPFTITNTADEQRISLSIIPAAIADEWGTIQLENNTDLPISFSLNDKEITETKPIVLTKTTRREIPLQISLPSDLPSGDYIYTVLITTLPPPVQQGMISSPISTRIGSLLIISADTRYPYKEYAEIADLDIPNAIRIPFSSSGTLLIDSTRAIRAQVTVKNAGNHIINPSGDVTIISGDTSDRYSFLGEYIGAGKKRVLKTTKSGIITANSGDSVVTTGSTSAGKGTISATIILSDGQTLTTSRTFIALPLKYLVRFIITFSIIAGFAFFLLRKKQHDPLPEKA